MLLSWDSCGGSWHGRRKGTDSNRNAGFPQRPRWSQHLPSPRGFPFQIKPRSIGRGSVILMDCLIVDNNQDVLIGSEGQEGLLCQRSRKREDARPDLCLKESMLRRKTWLAPCYSFHRIINGHTRTKKVERERNLRIDVKQSWTQVSLSDRCNVVACRLSREPWPSFDQQCPEGGCCAFLQIPQHSDASAFRSCGDKPHRSPS